MTDKHPYVPAVGGLIKVISHFRKSFPSTVTADTLKKLGFAPKNESYILNVLRYLELIDENGKQTNTASEVFNLHDNDAFANKFAIIVENAYSDLFDLQGDGAWSLDNHTLITFFRTSDQSTDIVGKRQAKTFQLLSSFSGYGEVPEIRKNQKGTRTSQTSVKEKKKVSRKAIDAIKRETGGSSGSVGDTKLSKVGLTVRIEINLPADGDRETYDAIFKSIRENLLNE